MDALLTDLHYAHRQLRKAPLFSCVAIATLAIGIGATTAIFSTVNATLLRPLPFPHADQLVDVHTRLIDGRVTTGLLSSVEIGALNESRSVVTGVAGLTNQPFDAAFMRPDGTPVNVLLSGVTERFFEVLGLPPLLGRSFTHEEHLVGGRDAPFALVVSDRAWSHLFGRDPGIVGKAIRIAELQAAVSIARVAPAALDLPLGTDFWFNLRTDPQGVAHTFLTIARMRPGVTIERLRGTATGAMAGLARTIPSDVGREYVVRSLLSSLVGDLGPTLLIVFGATALLLVLACVNVTNLLLARGMTRTREITVRAALGASRGRVVRQLLTESMVLAAGGALAGLLVAYIAVRSQATQHRLEIHQRTIADRTAKRRRRHVRGRNEGHWANGSPFAVPARALGGHPVEGATGWPPHHPQIRRVLAPRCPFREPLRCHQGSPGSAADRWDFRSGQCPLGS